MPLPCLPAPHGNNCPTATTADRRRGFALLITITLLAFLVLLLVSLATLTRVETQVAGNSQTLAQARQNALMALNIAIGQLQKTVGPDQRTTFRADMMDPNNVNGVPFNALPKPGFSKWIAAVGNGNSANYADKPSTIPVYGATGSVNKPILLNWLVSGNETASFTPQPDGHISSPASSAAASSALTYVPTNAVSFTSGGASSLSDAALTALSTNVTVNGQPAQLLVGPNSASSANAAYNVVDTTGATSAAAGASATPSTGGSDYVFAPKVTITAPAGTVPGFSTAVPIGRYAYWVGDENIKARANLTDNYLQQTSTSITSPFYQWLIGAQGRANTIAGVQRATSAFSAYITQHNDLGFMDKGATPLIDSSGNPANAAASTLIGGDFNYNNYASYSLTLPASAPSTAITATFSQPFDKIIADKQLPMIASSNPLNGSSAAIASSTTRIQTALPYRYHDISTASYSVLSDTYAGGLKKDLTAALAPSASISGITDTTPLFTLEASQDFVDANTWSAAPTWGQLRSYFGKRSSLTLPANSNPWGNISVQRPSPVAMGFHPVISYAALGFSLYRDAAGQLYVAFYPFAALCNPYPGTLVGNANDQLGFSFRNPVTISLEMLDAGGAVTSTTSIDLTALMGGPGSYLRFKLNTGNINSGSLNRYALSSATGTYSAGVSAMNANGAAAAQAYYVGVPVPGVTLSTNTGYKIRYTGNGGELDVVYATSDANALTNGYTPPTPSAWWHAVQHMAFAKPSTLLLVDGTGTPMPIQGGAPDVPVQPRLVMRANSILGASRGGWDNTALGMDANYKLRWFAQANGFRAPLSTRTNVDTWTSGTATATNNKNPGNNTFAALMLQDTDIATNSGGTTYIKLENGAGVGTYARAGNGGLCQYFDVPRDDLPLLSLGQLQNANLSLIDGYPTYPFGNSLADFRIASGPSTYLPNTIESPGSGSFTHTYYDLSWHLNRVFWDKYFVSSIPSGGFSTSASPQWQSSDLTNKVPLPDARMTAVTANPAINNLVGNNGYDQAAANLMVAGGFNVNSTSEQAWRALLAGTFNEPYRFGTITNPSTPDMATPVNNIQIPRLVSARPCQGFVYGSVSIDSSTQVRGTYATGGEGPQNSTRYLAVQPEILPYTIAKLAKDITSQIKIRGPFLSMGDFVNRRQVATNAATTLAATGLKGTLQAALDTNTNAIAASLPGTALTNVSISIDPLSAVRAYDMDPAAIPTTSAYSLNHLRGSTTSGQQSFKSRQHAGSLMQVTQADLLSLLGPSLFARSDTFTIRTYGETVNPTLAATDARYITGRAWCEAVVQRMPSYVDATTDVNAYASPTAPVNKSMGRKFKIVSFRWLTANDI